jgi:hypothetical protein
MVAGAGFANKTARRGGNKTSAEVATSVASVLILTQICVPAAPVLTTMTELTSSQHHLAR